MVDRVVKWDAAIAASRLRRRRIWQALASAAIGIILLSSLFDHVRAQSFFPDDWTQFDGRRATFAGAINGESIRIRDESTGIVVPVRILGIASFNAKWDQRAMMRMNAILDGHTLILHLEPTQTRDSSGRLLAFVFVEGAKPISTQIIGEGLGLADRRMGYAFHGEVEAAEGEARRKRIALWASADPREMPAWRASWFEQKMHLFSE